MSSKVARWIEQVTGRKRVWNQRGWDYLKRPGLTQAVDHQT